MDNSEQIKYWNGAGGEQWVMAQARMDAMLAPLSDGLLQAIDVHAGERVIDVGCGCGDTSLAMAAQGAHVWGVDVSGPMLDVARQRAQERNIATAAFAETDAAVQAYTPDHDVVCSRFGVMFFQAPTPAFANLHSALTEDGRLLFLCWQAPKFNAWMSVVGRVVQPFLPDIGAPPDPRAPGPFAFADADYVKEILTSAGYTNVEIAPLERVLKVGDSVVDALGFQQQVGPLARGLKALDEATAAKALAAAAEALQPHLKDDGIRLGAACWLVSANK